MQTIAHLLAKRPTDSVLKLCGLYLSGEVALKLRDTQRSRGLAKATKLAVVEPGEKDVPQLRSRGGGPLRPSAAPYPGRPGAREARRTGPHRQMSEQAPERPQGQAGQ